MIFQRGNPMDYERWAAEPGHEGVGLRPLPAVLQADGDLPRPVRTSGVAATVRWCSSAARPTNPLFAAFFAAAQEAGYPLTDDVNGYRQEGFARFDRNVHRGRRLSAARAYLHPVRDRKNLDRRDPGPGHQGPVRGQARGRRRLPARRPAAPQRRRRRGDPVRRRDQHPAAAPALRRRRRVAARGLGIDVVHHLARRRGEPPGPPRGLHPVRLEAAGLDRARPALAGPARHRLPSGCSTAAASAPPTTSRAAASSAATRTSTTRT